MINTRKFENEEWQGINNDDDESVTTKKEDNQSTEWK